MLDTARCEGDPMTLELPSSDYSFIWQGEEINETIIIDQSGHYTARLEAGECFAEDEITITFHPSPEYHVHHPDPHCEGDSTEIKIESPYGQLERSEERRVGKECRAKRLTERQREKK